MFYDSFIYSQNNSIYFGFHFMGRFATFSLQPKRTREWEREKERARAQLLLSYTTVTSAAEQQNIWRDGLLKDYIRLDNITTQSQGREKERKWKLKAEVL